MDRIRAARFISPNSKVRRRNRTMEREQADYKGRRKILRELEQESEVHFAIHYLPLRSTTIAIIRDRIKSFAPEFLFYSERGIVCQVSKF